MGEKQTISAPSDINQPKSAQTETGKDLTGNQGMGGRASAGFEGSTSKFGQQIDSEDLR